MSHHRQSIRLPHHDYAQTGMYYITLCAKHRENIFGEILQGHMVLNDIGTIVKQHWNLTPQLRPNISLGPFVIMPNHFHGIISIDERGDIDRTNDDPNRASRDIIRANGNSPLRSPSQTIGAIIRGFKSASTIEINHFRQSPKWKVWQRNYWERIIRTQEEYDMYANYILNNPLQWHLDSLNVT